MKNLCLVSAFIMLSATNISAQFSAKVIDIQPDNSALPVGFTVFNNEVYFIASDSTFKHYLWKSDGNTTTRITNFKGGVGVWKPSHINGGIPMGVSNGKLYFHDHNPTSFGNALYEYDGTSAPFKCFGQDSFAHTEHIAIADNRVFFIGHHDRLGRVVAEYDHINLKMNIIDSPTTTINGISEVVAVNNKICYVKNGDFTVYDPVNNSISKKAVTLGYNIVAIDNPYISQGKLYFRSNSTGIGRQIFEYDGQNNLRVITYDNQQKVSYSKSPLITYFFSRVNDKFIFSGSVNGTNGIVEYDFNTGQYQLNNKISRGRVFQYGDKLLVPGTRDLYDIPAQQVATIPKSYNFYPYGSDYVIHKGHLYCAAATDSAGPQELGIFFHVDAGVNVNEVQTQVTSTVYPNPTTGDVQLEFSTKAPQTLSIYITDMRGTVVYEQQSVLYSTGSHKHSLPTQHLAPSTYICTIQDDNGNIISTQKIIRQ